MKHTIKQIGITTPSVFSFHRVLFTQRTFFTLHHNQRQNKKKTTVVEIKRDSLNPKIHHSLLEAGAQKLGMVAGLIFYPTLSLITHTLNIDFDLIFYTPICVSWHLMGYLYAHRFILSCIRNAEVFSDTRKNEHFLEQIGNKKFTYSGSDKAGLNIIIFENSHRREAKHFSTERFDRLMAILSQELMPYFLRSRPKEALRLHRFDLTGETKQTVEEILSYRKYAFRFALLNLIFQSLALQLSVIDSVLIPVATTLLLKCSQMRLEKFKLINLLFTRQGEYPSNARQDTLKDKINEKLPTGKYQLFVDLFGNIRVAEKKRILAASLSIENKQSNWLSVRS